MLAYFQLTAYIVTSSLNTYIGYWVVLWKENYVVWIALEPWLNACPSMPLTRVYQIGLRGVRILPQCEKMENVAGEKLNLNSDAVLRRSDFDHLKIFQS